MIQQNTTSTQFTFYRTLSKIMQEIFDTLQQFKTDSSTINQGSLKLICAHQKESDFEVHFSSVCMVFLFIKNITGLSYYMRPFILDIVFLG